MTYYSYLVEHDYGLAPNPFGKYCTLAVCKPQIRKSRRLALGDWIIGTGSKALEKTAKTEFQHHLIFAMKVSLKMTFEQYWDDPRFQYKKPIMNGPLLTMYGDNFYHKDAGGNWIQEDSAHSLEDGTANQMHMKRDLSGDNVLISDVFYYFGDSAPKLPSSLLHICHTTTGCKKLDEHDGQKLIDWLKTQCSDVGMHGDPINWIEYK